MKISCLGRVKIKQERGWRYLFIYIYIYIYVCIYILYVCIYFWFLLCLSGLICGQVKKGIIASGRGQSKENLLFRPLFSTLRLHAVTPFEQRSISFRVAACERALFVLSRLAPEACASRSQVHEGWTCIPLAFMVVASVWYWRLMFARGASGVMPLRIVERRWNTDEHPAFLDVLFARLSFEGL